jgi:hypothetical protein
VRCELEQENSVLRPRRRIYTPEEEQLIFSKVEQAREIGLELSTVYKLLADELQAPSTGAIEQKYYVIRNKREKEGEGAPSSPTLAGTTNETSAETFDPPVDNMVKAIEKVVRERDTFRTERDRYKAERDKYKAEVERLLAERRKIQKLLGV